MKRVAELDSIRGIAALVVVLYHCSLVMPHLTDRLAATYVLLPFVAGEQAVQVFFVLSGFVLFGVLNADPAPTYSSYSTKRLMRLWLPVAAAVLCSAILYLMLQPGTVPDTSDWLAAKSWSSGPSLPNLGGHLALFNGDQYHELDNPIWSLAHEIKISLIFPFVVPAVARRPAVMVVGAALVSVLAVAFPQPLWLGETFDPAGSLYYLLSFVAGAAVAARREAIAELASSRVGREVARPLLFLAMVLLCSSGTGTAGYPVLIGAVILIGLAATSPVFIRPLRHRLLQWLGRISFSLYLVHVPVLLVLVHGLHRVVALPLILVVAPLISLGVAEVFYRLVERPSLRLASRVAAIRNIPMSISRTAA